MHKDGVSFMFLCPHQTTYIAIRVVGNGVSVTRWQEPNDHEQSAAIANRGITQDGEMPERMRS